MNTTGMIAVILTMVSFVPQVYKTVKTAQVENLSLTTLILFDTASVCWLIYGMQINDMPMIIANIFMTSLQTTLLIYKLKSLIR